MEISCRFYKPRRARESPLFRLVEQRPRFRRRRELLRDLARCAADHPLETWDGQAIMTLFRQALLERLVAKHAISEELRVKLLSWRHPGFSTHVGAPIPPSDSRAIEDMASYIVRNPVSLKRLVYIDGQQAVIYRALKPNPSLGANFVALDPLEWLARIADHIPDPGKHRTLFYARRGVLNHARAPWPGPTRPANPPEAVGATPRA